MPVNSVLVVGAGLMGSGIAQVCAQAGIRVMLHDMSSQALDSAKKISPGLWANSLKKASSRKTPKPC